MNRYKVTFTKPRRVFYVAALDEREAFTRASAIEAFLERVKHGRGRTLEAAVIAALTEGEDE